ncbi:MAG TPA: SgcJ/EcaC family oxidoreductase [Streptosporangiaceae bacterium]|jgi:uncharacterized protein (TIGR02246 family)
MSEAGGPARVLESFREAWDAGDAAAYGRLFTEDATYVIFMGEVMLGRAEIEDTHRDVFAKWQKGTTMIVEPLRTTMLGDDAAVVLTRGGIGHGHVAFDKFQTFTLVRRDGRWLIAAFQNTGMSAHAKRRYADQAPAGEA